MADSNGSNNNQANKVKKNNEIRAAQAFLNIHPNVPSGSDSTPTSSRMVPYSSTSNFLGAVNTGGMEVRSGLGFSTYGASSFGPPHGPGGQELLNKSSSTSDNSVLDSDLQSQNSNQNYKNQQVIYSGIYSSSGFDILKIMASISNRSNPKVELGPIDMGSSFVVSDARKYDFPIIYASDAFEKLTGFSSPEIIGRNCRFLQAPDGHVSLGSRRRYSDNTVIHRMKNNIIDGKEQQVSIVNYKKNGQPFINLLTIIPIIEDGEIIYLVGFQADLVEQPDMILQKMKDGAYKVNYNMLSIPKYLTSGTDDFFPGSPYSSSYQNAADVYESIVGKPRNEESHRIWNRLLIENADDMIYVLTMKGVFLYASPSCETLLGYAPEELVGYSVSKICHTSDLVPMMRELKEIGSTSNSFSLILRAKHKDGSYTWIETIGGLQSDNGKGRKCVILSARLRPVFQLSQEAVVSCGGIDQNEFWSKLSLDGLFLFTTSMSKNIAGYTPEQLIGTSMYQYMRADRTTALTRALHQTRDGVTVRLRHFFMDPKDGFIELVSTFYPGDTSLGGKPAFILCQTRPVEKNNTPDSGSEDSFSSSSAPSPCTNRAASEYDNMFDMLDAKRTTTWHFELNQLKLTNKKLKDDINDIEAFLKAKRGEDSAPKCFNCKAINPVQWRKIPKTFKIACLPCYQNLKSSSSGTTSSGTGVEPNSSESQGSSVNQS